MWVSKCLITICWKAYHFCIELHLLLGQRLLYCIFMDLFLDSLLCSTNSFVLSPVTHYLGYCSFMLLLLVVVFSCPVVSDSLLPRGLQHTRLPCPSLSSSLLKLMSIESVMPPNHLLPCHPLLLLPSVCPSIRVFSNDPALHIRWPKYWSFSFSISPSNEWIFRTDFL